MVIYYNPWKELFAVIYRNFRSRRSFLPPPLPICRPSPHAARCLCSHLTDATVRHLSAEYCARLHIFKNIIMHCVSPRFPTYLRVYPFSWPNPDEPNELFKKIFFSLQRFILNIFRCIEKVKNTVMDTGMLITSAYKSFNSATFAWATLALARLLSLCRVYVHYSTLN